MAKHEDSKRTPLAKQNAIAKRQSLHARWDAKATTDANMRPLLAGSAK